ncbi:MAG: 50S ribosomal protein L4 [Chlamydiota bacterium]
MVTLKKYDVLGKEIGVVTVEDQWLSIDAHPQMIKDYLVAIRNNLRQWSASTRNRQEVNHTGRKPHPQKGQGRARQGCLAAPQYKGGGRVHTPRPKFDQNIRINKKERRLAIRQLLSEKIRDNRMCLLQLPKEPVMKTKVVAEFLKKVDMEGKRVLFIGGFAKGEKVPDIGLYDGFLRSMRNIPRIDFIYLPNISGYDVAVSHQIVLMEGAFSELEAMLGKSSGV